MEKVKAVKVILTMQNEKGERHEFVAYDREVGWSEEAQIGLENGFHVLESDTGKREFKPSGEQTVTIRVRRK